LVNIRHPEYPQTIMFSIAVNRTAFVVWHFWALTFRFRFSVWLMFALSIFNDLLGNTIAGVFFITLGYGGNGIRYPFCVFIRVLLSLFGYQSYISEMGLPSLCSRPNCVLSAFRSGINVRSSNGTGTRSRSKHINALIEGKRFPTRINPLGN